MAMTCYTDMDAHGARVARLFAAELAAWGHGADGWHFHQDAEGASVRLDSAFEDDEPLFLSSYELKFEGLQDYTITDRIRHYLDIVLAPNRE